MYRMGQPEIDALARVINSGNLFKINDACQEVMHCEQELKELMGTDYALLMTSGKAALISALTGLGIGPGDEIIVPAYTYIATAIAVTAVGAIPVIAEADETLTLDVKDVERKISKYTKAIMPVHIQGFACNMDAICALAAKHSLAVVEDACQSIGGTYKGRMLGSIGDAGAFSFNFFKVISSGEGGALFTNDRKVYERALIYHDSSAVAFFGNQMENFTEQPFCGTEFRASELTGAMLRVQLTRLQEIIDDLKRNMDALRAGIGDLYETAPAYDVGCPTTLPLRFATIAEAREFATKFSCTLPIDTGKHVYSNWTPIMEKRGAFHPAMNPFKMEANRLLNHNYSPDMCPVTTDLLSRTAYIAINPDWSEDDVKAEIKRLRG